MCYELNKKWQDILLYFSIPGHAKETNMVVASRMTCKIGLIWRHMKILYCANWLWKLHFFQLLRGIPQQQRSKPYLSGGAKWKNLPDFFLFSPIFPLLHPLFPDFLPLFPEVWQIFHCLGGTLPPLTPPWLRHCPSDNPFFLFNGQSYISFWQRHQNTKGGRNTPDNSQYFIGNESYWISSKVGWIDETWYVSSDGHKYYPCGLSSPNAHIKYLICISVLIS